ncbi:MAG: integrase domain-containing protein [Rhodocyclales bacterium]|nr:integrase domain-containing protein [Rhodocyclales bacterium]
MSSKKPMPPAKLPVYARRSPAGSPKNPQNVLDTEPNGTRDWRRVLHCVLAIHNPEHSKLLKTVSQKTMLDRERFYFKFWDDLRFNTSFKDADPRVLTNRQVQAVANLWAERKLSVATVHNYLSFLRTYAGWIGRPGMVRDVATYFGADSHYVHRERTAKVDRSWIARCVEVEAKIRDVTAYDPWVGMQLELCYRFGLRAKEARHFRPHVAVISRELANPRDAQHFPDCKQFLRVRYGTKGGRPRDIPVKTPEQEELIERALQSVAPGHYVGAPGRTAVQNANRFYNVLRRFEITKAALGVTAHGLRHQHANDRYEELAGEPSPVRGGAGAGEADGTARMAVSSELGHGRIEITDAYLGKSLAQPRVKSPASGDEAVAPPAA